MAEAVVTRASDVCYVNAQGELVCGNAISIYDTRWDALLKPAIEAIAGIEAKRVALILQLIDKVMASPLDDDCIGTRTLDAVDSVVDVLAKDPPIMLVYRYNTLPGNILAAYDLQQNNFPAARAVLDRYAPSNLKPGC